MTGNQPTKFEKLKTMKEQELTEWIKQKYEATEGFALEQGPLYFQELIKYEIFTSIMWISLMVLLLVFILVFMIRFYKQTEELGDGLALFMFCLLGLSGIILVIIFDGFDTLIKAHSAPRVLILEHIKNL